MAPHSQRNQQSKSDRQVNIFFSKLILHQKIIIQKDFLSVIKFSLKIQASKPLMEKRRRERINRSLNELKSILLEALRRDVSKLTPIFDLKRVYFSRYYSNFKYHLRF